MTDQDTPETSDDETPPRCGFVAVVGAPNAGKSTLVNALVGTKVSIVSPKVQTTRTIVRGIAMFGRAQVVFLDTPGIIETKRNELEERMMANVQQAGWLGIGACARVEQTWMVGV